MMPLYFRRDHYIDLTHFRTAVASYAFILIEPQWRDTARHCPAFKFYVHTSLPPLCSLCYLPHNLPSRLHNNPLVPSST